MEKTEIGPPYQFMASWPKKFQLWGGQNTFGAQNNFGVPRFRIFNKKKFQFQFTGSLPKKFNFEGVKIFLGPKICLMYSILVFLTLESTKKWFVFIKNIKKFACWNIANFVMFLMKTNGTFKGHKS